MKTFLRIILSLVLVAIIVWLGLNLAYHFGWLDFKPPLTIMSAKTEVSDSATQPPKSVAEPTPARAVASTPKQAPTAPPVLTQAPTATPSPASVVPHATYRQNGEITTKLDGKDVIIRTFTYEGGYIPADDPWLHPVKEKENENSYARPLYGKTLEERVYNWLHEVPKSAHQLTINMALTGLIKLKGKDFEAAVNDYALELMTLPSDEYDAQANKWLSYVFEKLNGGDVKKAQKKHGKIMISTDWALELYMTDISETDHRSQLHARLNHDDDTGDEMDELFAIYDKNGKNILGAPKDVFKLICKAAGVNSSDYSFDTWVNSTEGGTHKWKLGKKKSSGGNNNKNNNPGKTTSAPTSTPAPATPAPESDHKKDPAARPQEGPGTGRTNPNDATDRKTETHVESTPPPVVTEPPVVVTQPPLAEPTAPPESCYQGDAVDDTTKPVPTAIPDHVNEQGGETKDQGVNDDASWDGSGI